jgi:hypothetical protein
LIYRICGVKYFNAIQAYETWIISALGGKNGKMSTPHECFGVLALTLLCAFPTKDHAAGNSTEALPDHVYTCAQQYGRASSRLPAPANLVKPKPMPKLLDGCTILAKGTIYTIVPTASILFHGPRTSIALEEAVPGNKKFVECKEFLSAYSNDVLVIAGTSTGIGRVSVTNSFARDEVKIVVAVDEKGVPACTVDLK